MLILALDTSTAVGSVALGTDEDLLGEIDLPVEQRGSRTVLPGIRSLLEEADRSPREVGAVAVGAGPGSFTGVRIAAALAKGLCAAGGARLFAYSSTAVLAAGTDVSERVCVLLPARREVVYAAAYESVRPLKTRFGPVAETVEEVLERLVEPRRWSFAGPGVDDRAALLREAGARLLPGSAPGPRAASLLELVWTEPEAGRVEDPNAWEPAYVRPSGAERGV